MERKGQPKWPAKQVPDEEGDGYGDGGYKLMPAHLFVLSFIRIGQVVLCLVLFWKAFTFRLTSSIELFCRSNGRGTMEYAVAFPFRYLSLEGPADCSDDVVSSTTRIWTGFGPTVILFAVLTACTVVYAILAVIGYALWHELYDADKKWPACDLLISLLLGGLWTLDCFLAYRNFAGLKDITTPDQVMSKVAVCSQSGAYCNEVRHEQFGESTNTFLFLGLACGLSCAVAVWFLVMETGLCPDDDDDELMYTDLQTDASGQLVPVLPIGGQNLLRPDFVPFPDHMGGGKGGPGGGTGGGGEREREAMQQQFADYLSSWKKHVDMHGPAGAAAPGLGLDMEQDRFANGFTFTPIRDPSDHVATISHSELKRDVVGNKVHSKFNLFKA